MIIYDNTRFLFVLGDVFVILYTHFEKSDPNSSYIFESFRIIKQQSKKFSAVSKKFIARKCLLKSQFFTAGKFNKLQDFSNKMKILVARNRKKVFVYNVLCLSDCQWNFAKQ